MTTKKEALARLLIGVETLIVDRLQFHPYDESLTVFYYFNGQPGAHQIRFRLRLWAKLLRKLGIVQQFKEGWFFIGKRPYLADPEDMANNRLDESDAREMLISLAKGILTPSDITRQVNASLIKSNRDERRK